MYALELAVGPTLFACEAPCKGTKLQRSFKIVWKYKWKKRTKSKKH